NDICVGAEIVSEDMNILVVTEKGYGKKTDMNEYRQTKRGSKGVKTLNITDKNGDIIGFKSTTEEKDLMIITNNGMIIRLSVSSISKMGRVTQGVRLINLKDENLVSSISVVEHEELEENLDVE
ncbi:DNA gyrase subunit A, partial [bacterium]|nr:DNA gyrase subunit A [bacterium]